MQCAKMIDIYSWEKESCLVPRGIVETYTKHKLKNGTWDFSDNSDQVELDAEKTGE